MTAIQRRPKDSFAERETRWIIFIPTVWQSDASLKLFSQWELLNTAFFISPQQNNYIGFLDFKKEAIKKLGMRANTCTFNPGVIVANLTEWRNQNVTQQLEHWMELNTK